MKIRINNEIIDYTLERERNLGEVVHGIEKWLGQSGFTITAVSKNNAELPMKNSTGWRSLPLDGIAELDIQAKLIRELILEQLAVVRDYFRLIHNEDQRSLVVLKDLLSGYEDVIGLLDNYFPPNLISESVPVSQQFRALVETSGVFEDVVDEYELQKLVSFAKVVAEQIEGKLREFGDPMNELRALAADLQISISEIADVSVLLQTGKDKDAMDTVIRFSKLSEKLTRLVPLAFEYEVLDKNDFLIGGDNFSQFITNLNGTLSELNESIAAGDTVLTGDLLEYEIAPKIKLVIETILTAGSVS
jgi:hypothetical protein